MFIHGLVCIAGLLHDQVKCSKPGTLPIQMGKYTFIHKLPPHLRQKKISKKRQHKNGFVFLFQKNGHNLRSISFGILFIPTECRQPELPYSDVI